MVLMCIWRMFTFMPVVVTGWGSVGMFVVYQALLRIVVKYVVCLCRRCDGCIICLNCAGTCVLVFRHTDVLCL